MENNYSYFQKTPILFYQNKIILCFANYNSAVSRFIEENEEGKDQCSYFCSQ